MRVKWWVMAAAVLFLLGVHVCSEISHARRMRASGTRQFADETIFVLIPVLRDTDGAADTLDSLFSSAAVPQRIQVAVLQHAQEADGDTLSAYRALARHPHTANVHLARYPYEWSEGAPSARALGMRLLRPNTDYVMWVDAHTRFARDWDEALIAEHRRLPPKSILTTLPPQTGSATRSTFVRAVPASPLPRLEAAPFTKTPRDTLPSPFFCAAFCFAETLPALQVEPYTNNLCLMHTAELLDRGFSFFTPRVCPVTQDWKKSGPSAETSAELVDAVAGGLRAPERVQEVMGIDLKSGRVTRKGVQQGLSTQPTREEYVCKLGGAVALGFID